MIKVGLTGGIGSGKSIVAKIFATLGIPIFDADTAAKNIMLRPDIKKEIIKNFGAESYIDQALNRPYISSIVFADKEKLNLLNSITHPATIQVANEWFQQQSAPYAIKEAALIFESQSHLHLETIIGVYADENTRIQRVLSRDHSSIEHIKNRMAKQMNEADKMALCDFIIYNDGSQSLIDQVLKIDAILRNKNQSSLMM